MPYPFAPSGAPSLCSRWDPHLRAPGGAPIPVLLYGAGGGPCAPAGMGLGVMGQNRPGLPEVFCSQHVKVWCVPGNAVPWTWLQGPAQDSPCHTARPLGPLGVGVGEGRACLGGGLWRPGGCEREA